MGLGGIGLRMYPRVLEGGWLGGLVTQGVELQSLPILIRRKALVISEDISS